MSRNSNPDCKVYVGDLGYGAAKQELEDVFQKYGPLRNVWVARNPPGFAFVEFEDPRDVEDACRALDGTRINGRRVRVEPSNGRSRSGRGGPSRRGDRGGGGRRGFRGGRSRSRSPRRRSPSPKRYRSRSRSPFAKRSMSKSPERSNAAYDESNKSAGRREWD